MKKLFLNIILLVSLLISNVNLFSQQGVFEFDFQIWKGNTYLGHFTGSATNNLNWGISSNSINQTLCPGDQLTIRHASVYSGTNHSFDGDLIGNPLGKCTIGLTGAAGCSSASNSNAVTHLADVCSDGMCYINTPLTVPNWPYNASSIPTPNSDITVTIPSSNSGSNYLMISAWQLGEFTADCSCGGRTLYIPISGSGETPDPIANQSICPEESVDLGLDTNYTYTNWAPNNPEIITPTVTTNYTVDVSDASSVCAGFTQNQFTITINNSDGELINDLQICFDDLPYYFSPYTNGNSPTYQISIDNQLVYDFSGSTDETDVNGNLTINTTGLHTIVWNYFTDDTYNINKTCSKEYTIFVAKNPAVDLGPNQSLCSSDPMPILDAGPNGMIYSWRYKAAGSMFYFPIVGNNTQYLNTANHGYGSYGVTVTNSTGCISKDLINITLNPSASANLDADFLYDYDETQTNRPLKLIPNTPLGSHVWFVYYSNSQVGPWTYMPIWNSSTSPTYNNLTLDRYYKFVHRIKQKPCYENSTSSRIIYITTPLKSGGGRRLIDFGTTDDIDINELARLEEEAIFNSLNNNQLSIYPNPTSGIFNVEFSQDAENTIVEVLNVMGKVILSETARTSKLTLDLSNEAKGIYLVKITANGNTTIEKVVYQ